MCSPGIWDLEYEGRVIVNLGYGVWGMKLLRVFFWIWDLGYGGRVSVLLGYGIWDMKVLRVFFWDMVFGI